MPLPDFEAKLLRELEQLLLGGDNYVRLTRTVGDVSIVGRQIVTAAGRLRHVVPGKPWTDEHVKALRSVRDLAAAIRICIAATRCNPYFETADWGPELGRDLERAVAVADELATFATPENNAA